MNRYVALVARLSLIALMAASMFGNAQAGGQRKEVDAKTAVRDADPSLTPVVAPGTSFTYRISLKSGRSFKNSNGDGLEVVETVGNVVVGQSRRVSNSIFEIDFSSTDNDQPGFVLLNINFTNSKDKRKFVRTALAIADPNGDQLVFINSQDKTVRDRSDVGSQPIGVDVAGSEGSGLQVAFVCNSGSGTVSVVNLVNGNVVTTLSVGIRPSYVAVAGNPGDQTAYVTNAGSNTVSVIDVEDLVVVGSIAVGRFPQGVAISGTPGFDERVWVANRDDDSLTIINVLGNSVVGTVGVADAPVGVAIGGQFSTETVVVACSGANVISLVEAVTGNLLGNVGVGSMPWSVAIGGPAMETAYVANLGADSVSFVDLDQRRETNRVPVGPQPTGITIVGGSDLEELYTANGGDGTVSVIEVARARLAFTIPIGGRPRGIATTGPLVGQFVLVTN